MVIPARDPHCLLRPWREDGRRNSITKDGGLIDGVMYACTVD